MASAGAAPVGDDLTDETATASGPTFHWPDFVARDEPDYAAWRRAGAPCLCPDRCPYHSEPAASTL